MVFDNIVQTVVPSSPSFVSKTFPHSNSLHGGSLIASDPPSIPWLIYHLHTKNKIIITSNTATPIPIALATQSSIYI